MSATTVLVQDLVQGTVTSASLPVPAGSTSITAAGLMSDADASNAANSGSFGIEVSFDGGQSFTLAAAIGWAGGTNPLTGKPNVPREVVGYSASGVVPTHARVRIDLPRTLSAGATLDFS